MMQVEEMVEPTRVIRTYLRLDRPAVIEDDVQSPIANLVALPDCTVAEWRKLYETVGKQWHWVDRNAWSDERLATHLANPEVTVFRVDVQLPGRTVSPAGFLELEKSNDAVEVVYLGLVEDVMGRGVGRWLVCAAVNEAWRLGARHVWLHTCTLDAPAALPNYINRGFRIVKTEEYFV